MEIMVIGNAKRFYTPDEVIIKINFYNNAPSYELALQAGVKGVENFIVDVIEGMNLKKENLKTNNFRIYEEKKFDYEKKEEVKLGFAYSQIATIKFDYSMEKVAEFMEKVAKLDNAPKCNLEFGIKEQEKIKNELLAEAYLKAKERAEVIACAAGKQLVDCLKTDFKPFNNQMVSNTYLDTNHETSTRVMKADARNSVSNIITNVFTPEDIEVSENIYCLWLAQ